jgi:hypothetical protein
MKAVNEARVVLKSHPLVRSSAGALLRRGMPPASHDITLLIGTEDARLAGYTPTVMLTVLCSIDQLLLLMSAICPSYLHDLLICCALRRGGVCPSFVSCREPMALQRW